MLNEDISNCLLRNVSAFFNIDVMHNILKVLGIFIIVVLTILACLYIISVEKYVFLSLLYIVLFKSLSLLPVFIDNVQLVAYRTILGDTQYFADKRETENIRKCGVISNNTVVVDFLKDHLEEIKRKEREEKKEIKALEKKAGWLKLLEQSSWYFPSQLQDELEQTKTLLKETRDRYGRPWWYGIVSNFVSQLVTPFVAILGFSWDLAFTGFYIASIFGFVLSLVYVSIDIFFGILRSFFCFVCSYMTFCLGIRFLFQVFDLKAFHGGIIEYCTVAFSLLVVLPVSVHLILQRVTVSVNAIQGPKNLIHKGIAAYKNAQPALHSAADSARDLARKIVKS